MAWSVRLSDDSKFIDVNYFDNVTPQELKEALVKIISVARSNDVHVFLVDCTKMKGGHSVFDLYFLMDQFQLNNVPKTIKEAVVFSDENDVKEKVKFFFETVSRNKGYNVKVFSNRGSAVKWLFS